MISTGRRRTAALPLCLTGMLAAGAGLAPSVHGRPLQGECASTAECAGRTASTLPGGAALHPQCTSSAECVPGACDPLCVEIGRYRVTAEIVDDVKSGHRLWQRRVSVRLSQQDAVRYCGQLTLDGVHGWRLPAPDELASIRYKPGGLFGGGSSRHYCIPSIDQAAFPETPAGLFWTSRTNADDTGWYVGFDDGRSHRDVRTDELWVRCVHDPLPSDP